MKLLMRLVILIVLFNGELFQQSANGASENLIYRFSEDGATFLLGDIITYKIAEKEGDILVISNLKDKSIIRNKIRKGSLRPLALDGLIFLLFTDGVIEAIDPASGRLVFKEKTLKGIPLLATRVGVNAVAVISLQTISEQQRKFEIDILVAEKNQFSSVKRKVVDGFGELLMRGKGLHLFMPSDSKVELVFSTQELKDAGANVDGLSRWSGYEVEK